MKCCDFRAGSSKQILLFLCGQGNIRDRLRDTSRFVIEKEREPGMLKFKQVSESNVQRIIGKARPQTVEQTQSHPN